MAGVLASFALAGAQAASFDCAKAQSKVEKLICDNPEVSKLDEEMAELYWRIANALPRNSALRRAHQLWLNHRKTCVRSDSTQSQVGCLTYLYRRHIDILRGNLPTDQNASINTKQLCVSLAELYETGEIGGLEPPWGGDEPHGKMYRNIDLDGDGIADKVELGCGSAECLLDVKLSAGGGFGFAESPFHLVRYQSHIYAVIGVSEDDEAEDTSIRFKFHMTRLYRVTRTGQESVCGAKY